MKAGDIVFVKGHSIVSKVVTAFDKGKYSHVAIAVSPTHICEAMWNSQVRIVPLEYTDYQIIHVPMSAGQQQLVVQSAIQHCGASYDFRTILSLMLKGNVKDSNANAYICSELVISILEDAGRWEGTEFMTPNQLYKEVRHKLEQFTLDTL